ncbi:MAG: hypothetical protein ACN4GZ_14050, partial [Acidimicrobiales bacterium]
SIPARHQVAIVVGRYLVMDLRTSLAAVWLAASACTSGDAALTTVPAETPITTQVSPKTEVPTTTFPTTTASTTTSTEPSTSPEREQPSHTDEEVVQLAVDLGVDRLLVADGTDFVAVADGVATRKSEVWAWSDGNFLYWNESSYDREAGVHAFRKSIASSFDWTVVCEFDEWRIHHVTERADGSLVAGVERPWDWDEEDPSIGESGRVEIPAFAVECSDGSSQAIASFGGYGGDGESWGVDRIADRVFTYQGDAEGNADHFNESGLLLNGEDIAGFLLYSDDGSDAVYQVYVGGWAAAPALSVRKIDTLTSAVLWTREFETPISSLDYDGDRVFVGLVPEGEDWLGYDYSTDRIVVLAASDGEIIDEVPTSLSVHFAG